MNQRSFSAALAILLGSTLLSGCSHPVATSGQTPTATASGTIAATTPTAPAAASTPARMTLISAEVLASAAPGGMCSLDVVSGQGATNSGFMAAASHATIFGGWAATSDRKNPNQIILVLKGTESFQAPGSTGGERADVAKAFNSPGLTRSGFNLIVDTSALPEGTYQVMILEPGTNSPTLCDTHKSLALN